MRVRAAWASFTRASKRSPVRDDAGSSASPRERLRRGRAAAPGRRAARGRGRAPRRAARRPRRSRRGDGSTTISTGMRRPIRSSRPMRCSTHHGIPGQVEQHEAAAELEVAALASALGRDEQARSLGLPEAGDLDVAARRGQLLVEDAGRELRALAERRAQHLERLAVRHEDERLLPGFLPARARARSARRGAGRRRRPPRPGGAVPRRRDRARRPSAAPEASARRTRSIFCRRASAWGAGARRTASSSVEAQLPAGGIVELDRDAHRGGRPPMSARRVELVHGGRGSAAGEAILEAHVLGKLLAAAGAGAGGRTRGRRPRAESRSGAGRGGPGRRSARPRASRARRGGPGGRRSRCASSTTSRSMPAATACSVSRGPLDQHLERDHRAAMHVERVEVRAEVARHVGEPRPRRAA